MRFNAIPIFFYALLAIVAFVLVGCSYSSYPAMSGGSVHSLPQQPKHIALLLPLQGQVGASGQAVRNGFLAAYYYDKQRQPDAPVVNVVDVSGKNVIQLYQQAVADGADFVVGPLTKEDLQTLVSQRKLSTPTLALNTLGEGIEERAIPNLYQFGLSPQEEAEQVADHAWQAGHRQALIIEPTGAWGQRVAQSFQRRWISLGGEVVGRYGYPARGDMTASVRTALKVGQIPKNSAANPQAARFVAQSRHDMDMIFLVAFPQQARQIKPSLAFYNAANIPVYATSLIYSGRPSPQVDADLNGIEFDDMPWILGPDTAQWSEIRDRIKMLWAASYERTPRLYALGMDAYSLSNRLSSLVGSATTFSGATGILSVDSSQYVKRQLEWARIENGLPQRIQ